jgi:hypothetical protein
MERNLLDEVLQLQPHFFMRQSTSRQRKPENYLSLLQLEGLHSYLHDSANLQRRRLSLEQKLLSCNALLLRSFYGPTILR